jgi:hypothetical protein
LYDVASMLFPGKTSAQIGSISSMSYASATQSLLSKSTFEVDFQVDYKLYNPFWITPCVFLYGGYDAFAQSKRRQHQYSNDKAENG